MSEKSSSKPSPAAAPPSQRKRTFTFAEKVTLSICLFVCFALLALSSHDILDKLGFHFSLNPVHLLSAAGSETHHQRAVRLLSDNPLVDGHNDLAIAIRVRFNNHIYDKSFTHPFESGTLPTHTSLKKIDHGQYAGAFWSAFWPCPKDIFDFSDQNYANIVRATLSQLDLLHRLSNQYPSYFPATLSAAAARKNFHKHRTHISPLIIEGLHQIGNSFSTLRLFHSLGVRYATLTWNCHNVYADAAVLTYANYSAYPAKPYWGGLSDQGRTIVTEMNRLGMIVDLAHVSPDTMRDVLIGQHNPSLPLRLDGRNGTPWRGALAPPIFSHSSVHAICPHPRNVPDDVLPLIKQRNSVVMINFNPDFIACHYADGADPVTELPTTDHDDATLQQVVRHIMYVGEKIGYSHVGIGSDFDGIENTPKGLEGVDKMPDLVAELLRQGVSEKDVVKVVGGNVLRVWDEVDRVSARLQKDGLLPAEDEPEGIGLEAI